METPSMLISWMNEAITSLSASLFDPNYGGVFFAVFVLVILYSMVSSINRLKRQIASASSELSAIRSTLKKIESSLGRIEAKRPPGDRGEKDIRDLRFE
jgi:membrane protein implicated in regulation of membrane protease activity